MMIRNAGADIAETDYWHTEHASVGLCYLSGNAGVWRLLVPEAAEGSLAEMRTSASTRQRYAGSCPPDGSDRPCDRAGEPRWTRPAEPRAAR